MTTDDIVDRGLHSPQYAGVLPDATHTGEGRNDGCKDFVHFDFKIVDGKIVAPGGVSFRSEAQLAAQMTAEKKVEEFGGKAADLVDLLG